MKKVYLAGSIYNNPNPAAWRIAAVKLLPPGWEAVDPLQFETDGMTPDDLVQLDYSMILRCQAIVARVSNPTWGTAMELGFAKFHRIPVFGWARKTQANPWLLAHVVIIRQTLAEAMGELKHVGIEHGKIMV